MVSMLFMARALVAFAPLTCVLAQYDAPSEYPLLLDATAEELSAGLEAGTFTSVDLVNAYVGRILEVNTTLHMVTQINPDAWKIATELDAERAAGKIRGPLHGLPILLKNNIATADEMDNTAGSYALEGARVAQDAPVAERLRKAGAILLGKANLSQWANFRGASSNGWSALGGQTYGAYYPQQDPSGSSSGSGVSASLGLAFGTLGTETDGSIVSPSQANNVVGIKATLGLTSRFLVIPISQHQDTVGPIARTVKDAAYILQAIAGLDPNDNYTSAIPWAGNDTEATAPNYPAACKFDALKGKRLGVPVNTLEDPDNANDPVYIAFQAALDVLREAGADIVNVTTYVNSESFADSEVNILWADLKPNMAAYLSELTVNPNDITNLEDVRRYTQTDPREEYPDRSTGNFDASLALNFTNTSPEFWANYQNNFRLAGEGGLLGALRNYSLDAIVQPTRSSSSVPAVIGAPVITVPLGAFPENTTVVKDRRGDLNAVAPNVPFGIAFAAEHFSEEKLIGFAYAYEQRTMVRRKVKPYIQPGIELVDVIKG